MERMVGRLVTSTDTRSRADDALVDRLNHRYATFILVVFAIVVSTKQYVGEPISCWCPAQFTDNHEDFTNKICWVTDTYYVPRSQRLIPDDSESRQHISYYQWVPMFLLIQSVFFYMPYMFWSFLNGKCGIDINSVVEEATKLNDTAWCHQRDVILRFISIQISRYLSGISDHKNSKCNIVKRCLSQFVFCVICGRKYGNYLVKLYMVTKFLYLGNILLQLLTLEAFLGADYHVYGLQMLSRLFRNKTWSSSVRFPRVTLCDFYVRQLGNIHRHTVQCVLPINLFNEKIFVFVWFLLVFMLFIVGYSLVNFICSYTVSYRQNSYIRRHLMALHANSHIDKVKIHYFVTQYLKQDGVFIIRLVASHAGEMVAAELISELWSGFQISLNGQSFKKIAKTTGYTNRCDDV